MVLFSVTTLNAVASTDARASSASFDTLLDVEPSRQMRSRDAGARGGGSGDGMPDAGREHDCCGA